MRYAIWLSLLLIFFNSPVQAAQLKDTIIDNDLTIARDGTIIMEGSVDDDFELTLSPVNPTVDRAQSFQNADGTIALTCDSGWTDDGTEVRLCDSTDEVEIGSAGTLAAKLAINGDSNEIQLLVQEFGSQANDIFVVEESDGTDIISVHMDGASGRLSINDNADIAFGNSATTDALLGWSTTGNDSLDMGLDVGAADATGCFLIMEKADLASGFRDCVAQTDPLFRIYSSDAGQVNDFIEFSHDQTNGVINVGSGTLSFDDTNLTTTGTLGSGAITATSYGGITEANLLDKAATEAVTGAYTFSNGATNFSSTGDSLLVAEKITHIGDSDTFISFTTGSIIVTGDGTELMKFDGSSIPNEIVFNEGGVVVNTRLEGENDSHLFFLDSSADAIGANNAGPTHFLDIISDVTTKSGIQVTKNVASSSAAVFDFIQDSTTGAIPTGRIQQDDISEGVIDFIASDRGAVTIGLGLSAASMRVELNGTIYVIPLFADQ